MILEKENQTRLTSDITRLAKSEITLDGLAPQTTKWLEDHNCFIENTKGERELKYKPVVPEELPDYVFFVDSNTKLKLEPGEERVYQFHEEARDLRDTVQAKGEHYDEVVDACAGGGHSSIPYIKEGTADHVTAIDINPRAVELAKINAELNGVQNAIDYKQGDLNNGLPVLPDKKAAYIANVPFALKAVGVTLESMRDGGVDGLEVALAFARAALESAKSGDLIAGMIYSRINTKEGLIEGQNKIQTLIDLAAQRSGKKYKLNVSLVENAMLWRGANGRKEQQNPMSVDMTYVKGRNPDEEQKYRDTAELYKQEGWDQIGYFRYTIDVE